jgi:hypothetical protein
LQKSRGLKISALCGLINTRNLNLGLTVETAKEAKQQYQIRFPRLPLAVYRELAAHLRQVEGVETNLIAQQSKQFDYHQSQIGGLQIHYPPDADAECRQRVEQILAYYKNRYGTWEEYDSQASS